MQINVQIRLNFLCNIALIFNVSPTCFYIFVKHSHFI